MRAQAICGLSLLSASPSALSRAGLAASAAGEPKVTRPIAAVPRTVWSTEASPLIISGMTCASLYQDRRTKASC